MFLLRKNRLLWRQLRRRLVARPKQRRIVLHIGAHKTGTTYIQHTLDRNRARLPIAFETVPRRDRDLHILAQSAASARTEEKALAVVPQMREAAARLATRFARVENLMITHEGLPGPLPGRKQVPGIYPFAQILIPAIVSGLGESGAEVSVVFYTRRFRDWQASLYRYRFRDQPERAYSPTKYSSRTGLPYNWKEVTRRVRKALGKTRFRVFSYENDRASGLLGRALFLELGLSKADIARMKRLAPVNVSRTQTRHDHEFGR